MNGRCYRLQRIFLIACALFVASESAVFALNPTKGGKVVRFYSLEPTTFDPTVGDDGSACFDSLLYNGLVRLDSHMQFVPDLAEKWTTSPDGLQWRFALKKNVLFHDGTELTADDVVATYRKLLEPGTNYPLQDVLKVIKGFVAEDRDTVLVSLNEPYAPILEEMGVGILPARLLADKKFMEGEFSKNPVGTGPFRLFRRVPGEITLTAFDRYFEGRPYLDSVVFKLDPDQKKAWISLMRGESDVADNLDYEDYTVTRTDKNFESFEAMDNFNFMLLFNLKDPLLSQKPIRQAIAFALDRKDIIDKTFPGGGVATTGPFRPDAWPYNPDPSLQRFDLQTAREILTAQGWKDTDADWVREKGGRKLELTILIDEGDAVKERAVKRIQWQLLQASIRADVKVLPPEELLRERLMPGRFQAALIQFNTLGDPDGTLSAFWDSKSIGKLNISSYRNPEVDRLIAEGRKTASPDQRAEIYKKVHALISADVPAVFLFYKNKYSAASSRIAGIESGFDIAYQPSMRKWYLTDRKGRN